MLNKKMFNWKNKKQYYKINKLEKFSNWKQKNRKNEKDKI